MTPAYGTELVSCHDTATVIVLMVMSFATGVVCVGLALARLGYFGTEIEQLAADERDEDQHEASKQIPTGEQKRGFTPADTNSVHGSVNKTLVGEQKRAEIASEPDPIESYQPPVIQQPPAWVHREGQLPVPFNPLGESVPSRRKSS